LKFWGMGVRSALLVVSTLTIGCTGGTVSQELVTPEASPAESAIPALKPIQSPAPATTAPRPAAAQESVAEAAPDELSAYALSQLAILSQTLGPRQSATAEEKEAADYLASQFAENGLSVQLQPFTVPSFSQDDSGLFLTQGDVTRVEVEPITGTSSGDVAGQLVSVGLARPEDIPDSDLVGKIALAERGLIPFREKAANIAAVAGLGAVIYNNEPGNFRGTLGGSSEMPVASVSQEDGDRLEAFLASSASFAVNFKLQFSQTPSQNVIAEKPGQGTRVVILGAHYDTVPDIAGANDNASGTAVLLTLARELGELSEKSFPFDLRLVAFGSEELGLRGSRHYVESLSPEQQGRVIAMLNFDALGSGSRLGVVGDVVLTRLVMEDSKARGIELRLRQSSRRGGSDHASFAAVGKPNIFFSSNDFSRLHTPEDTLESINPQLLGDTVRLALNLLDALAQEN
jgi:aminopeptidase YwaD